MPYALISYDGGTRWGVRWGEGGTPIKIHEYRDQEEALKMYDFLQQRYAESGRTDKPELVTANVTWQALVNKS